MKEVSAKPDGMRPSLDGNVVINLEIAIDAAVETSRRSHGGEGVAERDLRISHIVWIRCCALQAVLRGKRSSGIGIALPSRHAQEAESELILHVWRKHMRLANRRCSRNAG